MPDSPRSQAKGDFRAHDKTPGFDPAVAPMGTDAEAAGAKSPAPTAAGARPIGTAHFDNAASFADAMRPIDGKRSLQPGSNWPLLVVAAVVLIGSIVFLGAAIWR
jgi:hypothetical protein